MYVNCSICSEVYQFAVFNKANCTIVRTKPAGFCHSCFRELCPQCMPDNVLAHSALDDDDLCNFNNCRPEDGDPLKCRNCAPESMPRKLAMADFDDQKEYEFKSLEEEAAAKIAELKAI